jgi:hypothetical protein
LLKADNAPPGDTQHRTARTPWPTRHVDAHVLPSIPEPCGRTSARHPGTDDNSRTNSKKDSPPSPVSWTPKFTPQDWAYMDRSKIKGQPRLGAGMVHVPTYTTLYIDATCCEETRRIMRANRLPYTRSSPNFMTNSGWESSPTPFPAYQPSASTTTTRDSLPLTTTTPTCSYSRVFPTSWNPAAKVGSPQPRGKRKKSLTRGHVKDIGSAGVIQSYRGRGTKGI